MRHGFMFALAAVASLAAVPSLAQDVERYQLERTEDGYVRLDTVTGQMTLCQERRNRLMCRAVEEGAQLADRSSEGRAGQLRERIRELEERVAALEAAAEPQLPSEEEFEKTLGYMERFFRSFIGIVEELEDEPKNQSEPERPSVTPQQDRT